MLRDILLAGFLVVAAIYDGYGNRIPNALTGTMAVSGMLYNCFFGVEIYHPLLGVIVPFLCTCPLFLMRVLGAGDIKLLCAAGIFLGESIIRIMSLSFVCCAIWGLIVLVFRREFFIRMYRAVCYFICLIVHRHIVSYPFGLASPHRLTVPYAVFVFLAFLLDRFARGEKLPCWT